MDPIVVQLDPLTIVMVVVYILNSRRDTQRIMDSLPRDHDGLLLAALRRTLSERRPSHTTPLLNAGGSNHKDQGDTPDS